MSFHRRRLHIFLHGAFFTLVNTNTFQLTILWSRTLWLKRCHIICSRYFKVTPLPPGNGGSTSQPVRSKLQSVTCIFATFALSTPLDAALESRKAPSRRTTKMIFRNKNSVGCSPNWVLIERTIRDAMASGSLNSDHTVTSFFKTLPPCFGGSFRFSSSQQLGEGVRSHLETQTENWIKTVWGARIQRFFPVTSTVRNEEGYDPNMNYCFGTISNTAEFAYHTTISDSWKVCQPLYLRQQVY